MVKLVLRLPLIHPPSRAASTALPIIHDLNTSQSPAELRHRVRTHKLANLIEYLSSRSPHPSRVWAYYLDIFNVAEYHHVPLQVHQDVLRKSTLSTADLRFSAPRRISGDIPRAPHIYEARLKLIFRNIRAAGWTPAIDDYHFVLEQFAAVGHHLGAVHVYQELKQRGLDPVAKTFGLCMQAIAHRLTLPCPKLQRPSLISHTRHQFGYLLDEMCTFNIPFTSANLDLTARILKETLDEKGFDLLLKVGYNIDLAYPDRSLIADTAEDNLRSTLGVVGAEVSCPHPFSTSALNTTIDMLGRFGDVSKLVLAFEVLTHPLPVQPHQHFFSSLEDDDDDGIPPLSSTNQHYPCAKPNTTTYNTLLRHLSKAGHTVFARHYLIQAIRLERDVDRALRGALTTAPSPHEVLSPQFAINRGTLLPVFGEANRAKNAQLLRWMWSKLPTILRRKRQNLSWYIKFRLERSPESSDQRDHDTNMLSDDAAHSNSMSDTPSTDESSPPLSHPDEPIPRKADIVPAIDLDLDAPTIRNPPVSYFDINLHIKILRRDIEEIESFAVHLREVLGRTTQRIKERLGRRVWQDKDIFLQTDRDRRMKVSRHVWRDIVNFKPRYSYHSTDTTAPRLTSRVRLPYSKPGWIAGHRGLATFS